MDMTTTGLRHHKPAPQRSKRSRQTALDRKESAKVRKRSGGRCEVAEELMRFPATRTSQARPVLMRCCNCAVHVHHLIAGRGKRGVGISALQIHKQHVCEICHSGITGEVGGKRLILVQSGPLPVYMDCYRRVR